MKIYGEYITSIERAFYEIDKNWRDYNGIVIAGTHNPNKYDIELILGEIKWARENGVPLYSECFGYQLCFIEYCRNIIGIKDATSEEFGEKGTFVVRKRKDGLNVGLKNGESYWNNYVADGFLAERQEIPQNFFIAQFHASYQSSLIKPHKLVKSFIEYARKYTMAMQGKQNTWRRI